MMTADLLALLFEATLLTSAAVLAVLFLRGVWRRAFGVRAAILLWLIVPLAAGVAIAPDRMVEDREALEIMAPVQAWLLGEDPPTPYALERTGAEPFGAEVVLVAWTIGSMLMLGLLAIRQRRFRAGLGRLGACGGRLWVSEKEDIGPLVLGVISPKVIVPANFAERFDARQRRLMLAHEYTHLRRGDPVWNLISAAFRCLFWFNPLIHIGANVFRREQELACDDRVLAARRRSHRSYAAALLALEQNDQTYPALTFGPHPLKERIMQISRTKSLGRARRRAGVLAALLLGAALAAVAWAATPTTEVIADGASLEDRSKLFAFDVEVTVGDQTGSGRLTLRGDEARVLPEQVLMATDALTITYEEQEPGWRAEVSISRHGEEEFFVQAEIWQNGKLRRTPTMLIGGYNAASISISGAEAGDQDFRLELTPVPEDLLSHRISPLPVEEWPEEIREKVAAMPTSFSGDTPISEMLDQVAAAQGGLEEVTFTTPGRPLQDGSAPSEGANAETAITFSRERYYESNPDTDVPFNVYVEQEMRRFIEAENSRPDTRPEQ